MTSLAELLDPEIKTRGMILPFGRTTSGGMKWAVPGSLVDILLSMEHAGKMAVGDAPIDPNAVTDAALQTGVLGGLIGSAPAGALASNTIRRGKSALPMDEASRMARAREGMTKYEIAHDEARINAAKPIEQGGLGLPPDNTAMDRARAMGFVDAYHGTRSDISQIDPSRFGDTTRARSAKEAFFSSADPVTAESYAMNLPDAYFQKAASKAEKYFNESRAELRNDVASLRFQASRAESSKPSFGTDEYKQWRERNAPLFDELHSAEAKLQNDWESFFTQNIQPMRSRAWYQGSNIMPLKVQTSGFIERDFPLGYRDESYIDIINAAKERGAPGVVFKNTRDSAGLGENAPLTDIFATLDPTRVRSRFATFDPAKRDSADLLAMNASPSLSAIMLSLPTDEEKRAWLARGGL